MSIVPATPNDDYYFVVFYIDGGVANHVLRQQQGGDGFNIACAHDWLGKIFQQQVVVTYWCKITKIRYDQCLAAIKIVHRPQPPTLVIVPKQGKPN